MIEQEIIEGHAANCALHDDGPCTCGTYDAMDEEAFEAAGLTEEDFA